MTRWTTADIPDLSGMVAVATGGNSGIGFETAVEFARNGATTIIACRSEARGRSALERLQERAPLANVAAMTLDLADLSSIAGFADQFNAGHDDLNILVNNAGIMATPYRTTVDGFESQFGTNHLGHFALTMRLLPTIQNSSQARVVNVSSLAHRGESIDFEALNYDRESYNRWRAYGRSKLANLLFTHELQRRLDLGGFGHVKSLAAHPGISRTNIGQGLGLLGKIMMPIAGLFFQSAAMGALPIVRAATDSEARGGEYYGPNGAGERRGQPVLVGSSPESHDETVAQMLWERSEEMTGVRFEI